MSVNLYEDCAVVVLRELLAHEFESVHDGFQRLVIHHAVTEYVRSCHHRG